MLVVAEGGTPHAHTPPSSGQRQGVRLQAVKRRGERWHLRYAQTTGQGRSRAACDRDGAGTGQQRSSDRAAETRHAPGTNSLSVTLVAASVGTARKLALGTLSLCVQLAHGA
jgi:hypothetical protein